MMYDDNILMILIIFFGIILFLVLVIGTTAEITKHITSRKILEDRRKQLYQEILERHTEILTRFSNILSQLNEKKKDDEDNTDRQKVFEADPYKGSIKNKEKWTKE